MGKKCTTFRLVPILLIQDTNLGGHRHALTNRTIGGLTFWKVSPFQLLVDELISAILCPKVFWETSNYSHQGTVYGLIWQIFGNAGSGVSRRTPKIWDPIGHELVYWDKVPFLRKSSRKIILGGNLVYWCGGDNKKLIVLRTFVGTYWTVFSRDWKSP